MENFIETKLYFNGKVFGVIFGIGVNVFLIAEKYLVVVFRMVMLLISCKFRGSWWGIGIIINIFILYLVWYWKVEGYENFF